jgi:hypothetical protein
MARSTRRHTHDNEHRHMIELACSTHALAVDTALFAGPVALLSVAMWIATRRDRRQERS